jgi:hypothetical protein
MTEEELKETASKLAEKLKGVDGLEEVDFVQEDGPLEGEPASICLVFEGQALALGVLPL